MLEIETREIGGTSSARAVRRTGKIPGVLYGNGREALPFAVESRHLREALSEAGGRHAILEVKVPGRRDAGARDHQGHAAAPAARHAAALRPARGAHGPRRSRPPSRSSSSGEAEGVKTFGGILAQNAHELTIEALPGDLPEHVELDISALNIGDSIKIGDLPPSARASSTSAIPTRCSPASRSPRARRPRKRPRRPRPPRPPRPPRHARRRARREPEGEGGAARGRGVAAFFRLPQAAHARGPARRRARQSGPRYAGRVTTSATWSRPSWPRAGTRRAEREKHGGALSEVRLEDGTTVALLRPLGFMNLSGGPVQKAVRAYGLGAGPGRLRARRRRGALRPGARQARRRPRRPQRTALRGRAPRHARLRPRALRHRPPARRATAAISPTGCSRRSSPTRIRRRWWARRPTASS